MAYFSMPQVVIPFKLNPRAFIIAIFIIMATVRLLVFVFGVLLRWRMAIPLNKMALGPKTIERIGWLIGRRERNDSDDLEMGRPKTGD